MDTIFALSSGAPPSAIGIIRISGPAVKAVLETVVGGVPRSRVASLRTVRAEDGSVLDRALVLWFEGPKSATGEDLAELHCHGGRAILNAVQARLEKLEGLRPAEPGEFTRRAFENGRMDLAEAEGLADLLAAETELQRAVAQQQFGGALSSKVEIWRTRLLGISAQLEALMDFADEDDVDADMDGIRTLCSELHSELAKEIDRPTVEKLRSGIRVVLAGPPNVGKSSLFNRLVDENAAIVSPAAGTTRDMIERPIAIAGVPIVLVDTAGIHEHTTDEIESIGIERARIELTRADIVLWLGPEGQGPPNAIEVGTKADLPKHTKQNALMVSSVSGFGIEMLSEFIVRKARELLPKPTDISLNQRQRDMLVYADTALQDVFDQRDPLLVAESLRLARVAFDKIVGRTSTEDMLDSLFSGFCIGK
ncbi:tRNA uridine-5-carboxymethylaminomethyl(34) synthesis GTPase MnmE [Erythrobacter litoralis]|uniref:tRNA uridine-5-carboxymethylaminomethyl(34) synthesis GTPase MnmE n=1 Tax=Erythrobacter litoralis TaxID=39960 RepID=UPI002434EBE1|nr:tRNA uridine-5-carboxymethylaminomethyl(34) synthesis GTPase MnmE [Erythrobacter litoralis]MDG6079415.1 tRNA uridine-5-carboxymethylaminomethyl(34) synthesis GTPase MnmE [Erythrobacter litoralis]